MVVQMQPGCAAKISMPRLDVGAALPRLAQVQPGLMGARRQGAVANALV